MRNTTTLLIGVMGLSAAQPAKESESKLENAKTLAAFSLKNEPTFLKSQQAAQLASLHVDHRRSEKISPISHGFKKSCR